MWPSIPGPPGFSCHCVDRKISVGGGELFLLCLLPLLSFVGAFGHLASLERLVPSSRLCMRSLQWHLMTHWSPKSDHPSLPVPLSWAVWWISRHGWCGTVFSTGFFDSGLRLRICTCIRTRLGRDGAHASSIVSCPQCVQSKGCYSTSIFSNWRRCFGIALNSGRGPQSLCDHDMRWLDGCGFRQQVGRDSVPLPLLVGRSPSEVIRLSWPLPRYGISTRAVLCSGRSTQLSGSGYRGSMVSSPSGGDRSAARLGLPVAGLVREAPPRGASHMLFPRPESPGGLLGCISHSLWQPGSARVSTLPLVGWVVARVGETPISPWLWSPPLAREGVVRRPSPSLTRGSPGSLMSWQGFVSLDSYRLSVSPWFSLCPAVLGSGSLSWIFLCSLEISRRPSNLSSYVPLRGLSLSSFGAWHEICTFLFGHRMSVFLPSHCSSSWPLPWLRSLANSTSFSYQVSHSRGWRGLSFPFVPVFVAKAQDLLCSSVWGLHGTSRTKREHNGIGRLLGPVGRSGFTWPSRPHIVCDVSCCSSLLDVAWRSSGFPRSPSGSGRRYLGRAGFRGDPYRVLLREPGRPWVSLRLFFRWRTSLSPRCWRRVLGGSTPPSRYMRVLAHRSLETFHLGTVVPA